MNTHSVKRTRLSSLSKNADLQWWSGSQANTQSAEPCNIDLTACSLQAGQQQFGTDLRCKGVHGCEGARGEHHTACLVCQLLECHGRVERPQTKLHSRPRHSPVLLIFHSPDVHLQAIKVRREKLLRTLRVSCEPKYALNFTVQRCGSPEETYNNVTPGLSSLAW